MVILKRVAVTHSIIGLVVESHLNEGSQPILKKAADMRYGVSITDSCIGWKRPNGCCGGVTTHWGKLFQKKIRSLDMGNTGYDPMKPWFLALESMGEFIGMRLARIPPGKSEPEWIYVPHSECDGFAVIKKLFAERGGTVEELPQARHPARPSASSFFKLIKMQVQPRWRLHWKDLGASRGKSDPRQPAPAVAWHVFEEDQTLQMRHLCNAAGGGVNSFLLYHLTAAVRPCLVEGEGASVPWMIPVNMRGRVTSAGEISNHVSYMTVIVRPGDTSREIHQSTQAAMDREEHCTNWFGYGLGRYMPQKVKRFLIAKELATPQWYLGAFTNLGAWDSDKKITSPDCLGAWLATALVFRFQLFGAGCFTFQNRMSLCLQAHPELTTDPKVCKNWMMNWVEGIERQLAGSLTARRISHGKEAA